MRVSSLDLQMHKVQKSAQEREKESEEREKRRDDATGGHGATERRTKWMMRTARAVADEIALKGKGRGGEKGRRGQDEY